MPATYLAAARKRPNSQAFLFNSGQSSYLSATDGSAPNLSPGVGNLSVEFWVKPFLLATFQTFIGKGAQTNDATNSVGWRIGMNSSSQILATMADATDTTQVNVTGSATFILSRWQHVCLTADRAGSATIYQNGVNVGSGAITGEPLTWNTTADFVMGCRKAVAGTTSQFVAAAFDRIGVWQRLLVADEIRQAAQGRRLSDIADRTSLVSWWDPTFGLNDPISGYRLTNNAGVGIAAGYPL